MVDPIHSTSSRAQLGVCIVLEAREEPDDLRLPESISSRYSSTVRLPRVVVVEG